MYSNIYIITNNINNKQYVGQAIDVNYRWKQHIKDSKNKKYQNRYLYSAFRKYGINNFNIKILESNVPIDIINERETYWIKTLNTFAPNGYNLTMGGEGSTGRKLSKETKKKMSLKSKQWHLENKESFIKSIKNRNMDLVNSKEVILKRIKTWKSNPNNKEKLVRNALTFLNSLSKEDRKRMNEKAVQTKKEKGYDFYSFSFGKMTPEEKSDMYKKISKNNKRSLPILMLDKNLNIVREFHSIGEASRYLAENYGFSKKGCKSNIRKALDTNKIIYNHIWKRK